MSVVHKVIYVGRRQSAQFRSEQTARLPEVHAYLALLTPYIKFWDLTCIRSSITCIAEEGKNPKTTLIAYFIGRVHGVLNMNFLFQFSVYIGWKTQCKWLSVVQAQAFPSSIVNSAPEARAHIQAFLLHKDYFITGKWPGLLLCNARLSPIFP